MGRILVERGITTKLAKHFGCTDQTIRNALRGVTEGERTEKIRKLALEIGGVERKKTIIKKELL